MLLSIAFKAPFTITPPVNIPVEVVDSNNLRSTMSSLSYSIIHPVISKPFFFNTSSISQY